MNGRLELRIITQPYSAVYWGYFRGLVFGNSLTKHIKLSSFSYSVVIFVLPISHIPPCFHASPPDFPRLIGPRGICNVRSTVNLWSTVYKLFKGKHCVSLGNIWQADHRTYLKARELH